MFSADGGSNSWQTACRVAGWLGVAAIVVVSVVPGSERPHSGLPGWIEHMIAYALTSAALALGYRDPVRRLRLLAMLLGGGAVLELVQIWVPGRTAHILDAAAGWLGAALGTVDVRTVLTPAAGASPRETGGRRPRARPKRASRPGGSPSGRSA